MSIRVGQIVRYPIKGLTGEILSEAYLQVGQGLPLDRRYALAHGSRATGGPTIRWMEKNAFLMLARHARLAQIQTSFEPDTGTLTIRRGGKQVARGKITDRIGRALIEEFFAAFMGSEAHGKPKLVEIEEGSTLSDVSTPMISLINSASVHDLERVAGCKIDVRRFRGNVVLEGAAAWEEFGWIDRTIRIGDATLKIVDRTSRCPATSVNPDSAELDHNVPQILQRGFGHADCGVYAEVIGIGAVKRGDRLRLLS